MQKPSIITNKISDYQKVEEVIRYTHYLYDLILSNNPNQKINEMESTLMLMNSRLVELIARVQRTTDELNDIIEEGDLNVTELRAILTNLLDQQLSLQTYVTINTNNINSNSSLIDSLQRKTNSIENQITSLSGTVAVLLKLIEDLQPTEWQPLPLKIGWITSDEVFNTASYRKVGDKVELRGWIKRDTTDSRIAGVIPVGLRPLKSIKKSIIRNSSSHTSVTINPIGEVITELYVLKDEFSLDGIYYYLN